ncbi:fimbrillin family protein [uncultured Bacteroides sp.]|uniref:fimbrillin family protein n=1 Tax=uncultured Bacteroides sp. TaxID=162156 RepID=UPI0025931A4E|nr:fimbrillin family protein [uncultured Bacteroides sp.]
MKLKLSVIITAACLIAGCSSEKTIDKGTPDENGMVYIEFSSGTPVVQTNSRTQLGEDGLGVNWSDGDNISVFSNEGISYQFTEKGIDGDGSAVFGGMITEGGRRDICIIPL